MSLSRLYRSAALVALSATSAATSAIASIQLQDVRSDDSIVVTTSEQASPMRPALVPVRTRPVEAMRSESRSSCANFEAHDLSAIQRYPCALASPSKRVANICDCRMARAQVYNADYVRHRFFW